ncbi:MAG: hypothetical protein EP336_17070 [Rhodobacteraceae bacterium]|nr:MAG: hypothetical protein EP336_17070 [Paracoccaceae bacterium]
MTLARTSALLIALSAITLASMIPGGFVETRNFSGYSVAVLAAFNVFLTVLGLGSLVLAYRTFSGQANGIATLLVGLAYVAVYLLDLGHIFPIADSPMQPLLATLEWLGTLLGAVTMLAGGALLISDSTAAPEHAHLPRGLLIVLAVLALGIVLFATISAA